MREIKISTCRVVLELLAVVGGAIAYAAMILGFAVGSLNVLSFGIQNREDTQLLLLSAICALLLFILTGCLAALVWRILFGSALFPGVLCKKIAICDHNLTLYTVLGAVKQIPTNSMCAHEGPSGLRIEWMKDGRLRQILIRRRSVGERAYIALRDATISK
jgi:hypothetical protein